jgi:tellurite resistance protein TerC
LDRFHYLKSSLVFVLIFVGGKMVLSHHYPISSVASLAVIVGILLVGVLASMLATRIERARARASNGQVQSTRGRGNNVRRVFVVVAGATVGAVGTLLIIGSLGAALAFPVLVVGLLLEFAVARGLVGKLTAGVHGPGEIAARHVNVSGSQGAAKGSGVEPTA